jgi:hypothetical protein
MDSIVVCNFVFTYHLIGWLFSVVKPWLHERTLAKIVILGSDFRDTIKEHLPAGIIPDWAGGECVCPGGCVYEPHLAAPPTEIYIPAGIASYGVVLILIAVSNLVCNRLLSRCRPRVGRCRLHCFVVLHPHVLRH